MEIFNQFVNYGRYNLELLVGVFVLCTGLKKSDKFLMKLLIISGLSLILTVASVFISLPLIKDNSTYRTYISYAFFLVLSLPAIFAACFCYNSSPANKIYVIMATILSRNTSRTFYNIILFVVGEWMIKDSSFWQYGDRSLLTLPVYYLVFAGFTFLLFVLTRRVFTHPRFKSLAWGIILILPIAVILNLFVAIIENGTMYSNSLLFFFSSIVDIVATSSLLLSVSLFTFMSLNDLERAEDREQFNSRIKQYESISESIELINHKCHDLRHQLRAAQLNGGMDQSFIEDVVRSIDIYDHRVDTGNKDLDMLLMDFKFRASSQNIKTVIMADGSSVSFLERQDLISLFSNMFENAMNHVKKIEKDEEKYISLKVYKKDGFVFIDCENPFIPSLNDGPKDNRYHGFGIPSMKRIAKKYEGALTTNVRSDVFVLTVTFIA